MKNIKKIIGSLLLATAFAATSVGTTFALFTDEAKTTINVQSGKIELKSALTIAEVKSLNNSTIDTHTMITDEAHKNASYENGGAVAISTDSVTNVESVSITKWTPGDSVKLLATPNNSGTNINTLIRLQVTMTGELAPALVVKGYAGDATDPSFMMTGERTNVTPWTPVNAGENPSSYYLEVSFPNHGSEITSNLEGTDNHYQNKEASIIVSYQAVQGNASTNDVLERANSLLATHEVEASKRYETMNAALKGIESHFTDAELVTLSQYVWGSQEDQFFVDEASIRNHNYFKQVTSASEGNGYSLYAKAGWTAASVPLTGIGFDAGDVSGITSVTYGNATDNRTVIIRTNSAGTSLTINDGSEGKIYHYGPVGDLNIIECHTNSYHEFGKVAYAQISTGRIVLEPTSNVEKIHINANEDKDGFKEIIIADNGVESENLPTSITRDKVDVDEQKIVVTVQNLVEESAEPVYVYPHTDATETATGTTEKITEGENKQNENVESAIGQLVLDAGSDAGEKAMSENEKEAAKEEAVEEAIVEEVQEEIDSGAHYVCRIGAAGFETFLDAVLYYLRSGKLDATIFLLEDCEYRLGGRLAVTNGMELTIDLNGHTLTHSNDDRRYYIDLTDNGTLNVVDNSGTGLGTLTTNISSNPILNIRGSSRFNAKNVKLTNYNNNLSIGGSCFAVMDNVTMDFTNSNTTSALSVSGSASLELKNSTLKGGPALQVSSTGNVSVTNCQLEGRNSSILTIQNSSTGGVTVSNSTLSVRAEAKLQVGLYVQQNTKVVNLNNVTIDMGNSTHGEQYAIRLTSEGVSTINANRLTVDNVTGYGICMDMDGYGDAIFTNSSFETSEETVEMDHAPGHVTFNEGCVLYTEQDSIYYTYNGSMTTLNPGVALNVNPGVSNYKYTVNGLVGYSETDEMWHVVSEYSYDYYVTADNSENYRVNQFGAREDLTDSWAKILGTSDYGNPVPTKDSNDNWVDAEGVGMAKKGDTIHFADGIYHITGKMFVSDGVTLLGESREGTIINNADSTNFSGSLNCLGDAVVKNMTLKTPTKHYAVTPVFNGLTGDDRTDYLNNFRHDITVENCLITNTEGSTKGYAVNFPSLYGDLTVKNCSIVSDGANGMACGLCGLTSTGANTYVITGNAFENVAEAIGWNHSDYLHTLVDGWLANNTFTNSSVNEYGHPNA